MPEPWQQARAMRLSYIQVMLNAVFGASTGGMFLIGFALRLGADDVLLGVLSTVPQFFVLFQFVSAYLIQRDYSRRKMTVLFAFATPLCWFLIAAIPLFVPATRGSLGLPVLIGVVSLVTVAGQFVANARSSWLGELIPAEKRGRFFGYCGMFAGIVGAAFAVAEGGFLDAIKGGGLMVFTALFLFGSLAGVASAALNLPQPDCPLSGAGSRPALLKMVRETLGNRPLVALALVHAVIALGGVAGPFNAAYSLRDVHVSFMGLGLLNAVGTAAALLASPFWGRMVDRFGCRPILILGLVLLAPCSAVWLAIPPGATMRAYWLLPWTNFIAGAGSAAVGIALSTMIYKTSRPMGRSVQFAAYSAVVTLVAAPMPLLGGWLVSSLQAAGVGIDLRLTFYLWSFFMFAGAVMAVRLKEPESARTRAILFNYFPSRIADILGVSVPAWFGVLASLEKFQLPPPKADHVRTK